jgi:hypothetical protein
MTRQEYIEKWRDKYLGLACYGSINQQLPVAQRDANIWRRCEEVERLLGQQYDDLVPLPKPALTNGQTGVKRP